MCRAIVEGGRRCGGGERWHVNREGHERFAPDTELERHWTRPTHLLSMGPSAVRQRRRRARAYAAEVCAMRDAHGVVADSPIGPVLREELWEHRYRGAALSLIALADRFREVAREEGVPVEEVAERHAKLKVRPARQRAGGRLADLVVERAEWARPEYLVRAVEPPVNGDVNPAYLRVVRDVDGAEFLLVSSFDGSEPMAWRHTEAALKAAFWECLARVRAVNEDPTAYDAWLDEQGARGSDTSGPWTQAMNESDFFAHSGGMHLL